MIGQQTREYTGNGDDASYTVREVPPHPGDASKSGEGSSVASPRITSLRIMSYNILNGGRGRLEALARVITDASPDVIGLQELHDPDALSWLAERLGMHAVLGQAGSGEHVGALARWPLRIVPHPGSVPMQKTMLETRIALPDGSALRFFVVHLAAQYAALFAGEGQRAREIRYILARMRQAQAQGEPQVLVGDFNSLAPGESLRASTILRQVTGRTSDEARRERLPGVHNVVPRPLSPLVTPLAWGLHCAPIAALFDLAVGTYVPRRVVRYVRRAGYVDCYAALRPVVRQRAASCPAPAPAGRIDYIFASPELATRLLTCDILGETPTRPVHTASDHCPVVATFDLTPRP